MEQGGAGAGRGHLHGLRCRGGLPSVAGPSVAALLSQQPAPRAAAPPAASTSGRSGEKYDYNTALQQLDARVERLHGHQQQQAPPRSALGRWLRLLRSQRANLLVAMSLYSITTATVISAIYAERQKQVGTHMA